MSDEEPITLAAYGKVWTDPGGFPEIFGYEDRVAKIVAHLDRADTKSFVLIGDSGVGKTAILYAAFRVLTANGWTVLETSTAEMVRGAVYIGEWQKRLTELMELASAEDKILIYNRDIHNLRGAGAHSKSDADMAEAVTIYLDRGEITLIGECTHEAFERGIETSPGLKRQLTAFQVVPPKPDEVGKLIRYAFDTLAVEFAGESGCDLELPDATVNSLEQLGGAFFSGTAQPGASIELLRKIVELRRKEIRELKSESSKTIVLGHSDIVAALHRVSGLPIHLLDDNVPLDLKGTREFFESRVVGQDAALSTVTDLITLIKAGLTDPGKPTSIMFFAGPTGVGKTELAKALAEFLFGSEDRMIRCDMSEYKDHNSFEKFVGRPDKGNDSASLVSRVRRQPFSIILLDEVEKANPNIFDLLLQAFDDGRLTDSNGNTTDLTQTIIIMTSNLGSDLSRAKPVGFDSTGPESSELVSKALQGYFRPEFLNRIDHIIQFLPLQRHHIRTLAKRELGKALLRNGLMRRELRVSVEPEVHDLLAREGYDERYGARPLRRQVEKLAVLPVAREIIGLSDAQRGALLQLSVVEDTISVTLVEDRQARTAQKMVRGIEVLDPVDGSKKKVSLSDISDELRELAGTVSRLQKRLSEEELEERKSELLESSLAADFWDDQPAARRILNEVYRLERLFEAVSKVAARHEQLEHRLEILREHPNEGRLLELALELRSANHYSRLVSYAMECRDKSDRRDAYIAVTLVGEVADVDVVFQLVEAYRKWAARKDYSFRIIHEEEVSKTSLREVVFELGGPAAYGIFHAEEGEHEFVFGKAVGPAKRNCFISVRVLGMAQAVSLTNVDRQMKSMKRASRFEGTIRTSALISDRESGRAIEIESPLRGEALKESSLGLLEAEIEHSRESVATHRGTIVRKYVMSPAPAIKDQRFPSLEIRPREFWRGDIDELLQAGIVSRNEKESLSASQ